MNLRHLWGNSNSPGDAENCEMDDNVTDTPLTSGWTSCNLDGETCGSLDNVQNYMEYSYCGRMFTEGQRTRMRAAMNSNTAQRNQLWTPENLENTGVNEEPILCEARFNVSRQTICTEIQCSFLTIATTELQLGTGTLEMEMWETMKIPGTSTIHLDFMM